MTQRKGTYRIPTREQPPNPEMIKNFLEDPQGRPYVEVPVEPPDALDKPVAVSVVDDYRDLYVKKSWVAGNYDVMPGSNALMIVGRLDGCVKTVLYNHSTSTALENTVYIGSNNGVTAATGYPLASGEKLVIENDGEVYAVASSDAEFEGAEIGIVRFMETAVRPLDRKS